MIPRMPGRKVYKRAGLPVRASLVKDILRLCGMIRWDAKKGAFGRRYAAPGGSFIFGISRGRPSKAFPTKSKVAGKEVFFNTRPIPRNVRPVEPAQELYTALQTAAKCAGFTKWDAIQCNRSFGGVVHRDKNNTGPQCALSVGTHAVGGGMLLTESEKDPASLVLQDTRNRMTVTDGRLLHKVTKSGNGTRYSFIFYPLTDSKARGIYRFPEIPKA